MSGTYAVLFLLACAVALGVLLWLAGARKDHEPPADDTPFDPPPR